MQMHVAPSEDDLQHSMEGGKGHVATDEEPAPNQRADVLYDHTELIDPRSAVGGCVNRRVMVRMPTGAVDRGGMVLDNIRCPRHAKAATHGGGSTSLGGVG
jgi:hypothetical protein